MHLRILKGKGLHMIMIDPALMLQDLSVIQVIELTVQEIAMEAQVRVMVVVMAQEVQAAEAKIPFFNL